MKPENTREAIILHDGMTARCCFNFGRDECEQDSTERVDMGEAARFRQWLSENPRSPIWFRATSRLGALWMCDTHVNLMRDMC